jgi:hypothetical protein
MTGATVAAAGVAVETVMRPARAAADDGDPLLMGQANTASTRTVLTGSLPGTSDQTLEVINTGISGSAIHAQAVHTGGIGIRAEGNTGVSGSSYDTTGSGVYGEDLTGSSLGRGVIGTAVNGWGVTASSTNGQALRVLGRATFDRTGLSTITYPNKSVTVAVPGPLSASSSFPDRKSVALAMLQTNVAGVFVSATTLNVAARTLTIYLNKAPGTSTSPKTVNVGWFIVN